MLRLHVEATSASLLVRLRERPADERAWAEFVARYGPPIREYCRAASLQAADAEDVTQSVLTKLVARLRTFRYDPQRSFRAWLFAVARSVLCDYLAEQKALRGSGDSAVLRLLDLVEAREDLARRLRETFDHEVLAEALRRVRLRTPARQWEAFRLAGLEGKPGVEVSARLDMPVATVFTAKSKVRKAVRDEVRRLGGDLE